MAYKWCSVICENHQRLEDWECVLFTLLEIGFRHVDFQDGRILTRLIHTERHRKLVEIVFQSQKTDVIADLLCAWTTRSDSHKPAHELLGTCMGHLVSLHNLAPFSSRLRRLIIRSIELIGHKGLEGVGVERFTELLDYLHVTVADMNHRLPWAQLLLYTLQNSEGGARHLSHWYWELLVELVVLDPFPQRLRDVSAYNPWITTSLVETQEWSKLEYWMGTVWIVWPVGTDGMTEEDFNRSMLLLFRQRPGASQKLEQWMERWGETRDEGIPESFHRTLKQANEVAQQDAP